MPARSTCSSTPPTRGPLPAALTGAGVRHPPGRQHRRRRHLVHLAGARRRDAAPGGHRARLAVQHHLQLGHHRHAQRHRAEHVMRWGRSAAPESGRLQGRDCVLSPRRCTATPRWWWSPTFLAAAAAWMPAQIRLRPVAWRWPKPQGHAHHAGTGAVPAPDGAPDFDRHDLSSFRMKPAPARPSTPS